MINSKTYMNTVGAAVTLAEKGIALNCPNNSLMGNLVSLSTIPVDIKYDFNGPLQDKMYNNSILTEECTRSTADALSDHSIQLDSAISTISTAVKAHLSHAKNTVSPLVVELAESYISYSSKYMNVDVSRDFNIKIMDLPSILNDSSFLDNFSNYKTKEAIAPEAALKFKTKQESELILFALTGNARIDTLIKEWLVSMEEGTLTAVWENVFTNDIKPDLNKYLIDISRDDMYTGASKSLLIYLFASRALADVQESDFSLSVYKRILEQYRDYSGIVLTNMLFKISNSIKLNSMLLRSNTRTKEAVVNGPVYNAWLAKGGSPEVILGLLVSDKQPSITSLIDERKDQFLKAWKDHCIYATADLANKKLDASKVYLRMTFSSMLSNQNEVEVNFAKANPAYYDTVKNKLDVFIDKLNNKDFEDIYSICLKMIAGIRFYYTSSYQLLNDISEASKVNPNIDAREAALLATVNYVTDYVANQLTPTKEVNF